MKRGFFTIMWAQFFSALADNALLVAALQLMAEDRAAEELKPLLKLVFAAAYVLLAPFVGAFADSRPKGQVMFGCNALKVIGCLMMLGGLDPLLAYAVVGIGAASYSPAKYGIVTELLPASQLVVANAWIEGLTVGATVLGTVVGAVFISDSVAPKLAAIDVPFVEFQQDTPGVVAIGAITGIYFVAAMINLFVPRTEAPLIPFELHPVTRAREFLRSNGLLWKDPLGRLSLTVTTLFWGAGGTLQVLAIQWAEYALGLPLSVAGRMPGVVALGVVLGSVVSARRFALRDSVKVVPLGILMGLLCIALAPIRSMAPALSLMLVIGVLSGFFVVPLNALLQHRGHSLMGAGQSIAVQNFNENLSICLMTGLTSITLALFDDVRGVPWSLGALGAFVALTMVVVELMLRRMLRARPTLVDEYVSH